MANGITSRSTTPSTYAEHLDSPTGLLVPFFGNGLLDESETDIDGSDDEDGEDDEYTISGFGDVSLTQAYKSTSNEMQIRQPLLKVKRPHLPRGRTKSDKNKFPHEAFLKSLRCVTSKPPTSPGSDFQSLVNRLRSARK